MPYSACVACVWAWQRSQCSHACKQPSAGLVTHWLAAPLRCTADPTPHRAVCGTQPPAGQQGAAAGVRGDVPCRQLADPTRLFLRLSGTCAATHPLSTRSNPIPLLSSLPPQGVMHSRDDSFTRATLSQTRGAGLGSTAGVEHRHGTVTV